MLTNILSFSILLPTIAVFLTIWKQPKTLKKLSVFVLITAVLEATASFYVAHSINNMFLFHIYSYIEVIGIAWIYWNLIKGRLKIVIITLVTIFLLFSIINIINWETLLEFNANQRYVGGMVITIFTLLYFSQIFIDAKIQRIESDHYFWFSSILLIYTAGTLFLFILGKQVHTEDNHMYWDLHNVLNVLLNIGFALTLWMGTKKSN